MPAADDAIVLASAAGLFMHVGESHAWLHLAICATTVIVGCVLVEQRRAHDPNLSIQLGRERRRLKSGHADLATLLALNLEGQPTQRFHFRNVDVSRGSHDVVLRAKRELRLRTVQPGDVEVQLRELLIHVHPLGPVSAVLQQQQEDIGLHVVLLGPCLRTCTCCPTEDVSDVTRVTRARAVGSGCVSLSCLQDVLQLLEGIGQLLRNGRMLCQGQSSNLHALVLQVLHLLADLFESFLATLPIRADVHVKLGQLVLGPGDHRGPAVWNEAADGLLIRSLLFGVANLHPMLCIALTEGNSMKVHSPVDLTHGLQSLGRLCSVQAQNAIRLPVEAHGESSDACLLSKTWDPDIELPCSMVDLGLAAHFDLRPAQAKNAFEGSSKAQRLVNHQQQTILHEGMRVANSNLVGCDTCRNLTTPEGQQHGSRQHLGLGAQQRVMRLVFW
mmetsp:Transcript_94316/g.131034  ORF Transcript_94316/g.131034 Transcript_94316/m.131034 type:complete len:444 (+) Transcript_94316:303-1634(+)